MLYLFRERQDKLPLNFYIPSDGAQDYLRQCFLRTWRLIVLLFVTFLMEKIQSYQRKECFLIPVSLVVPYCKLDKYFLT